MAYPDPVEQIKTCIARLELAWNHQNAILWASAFTNPCEYIDAIGIHHPSWSGERNARLHDSMWKTIYKHSSIRFSMQHIELLTDHLAMVVLKAEVHYRIGEEERTNTNTISALLQRHGAEWGIKYFQNTPYKRVQ